jgi:carboxypeptidase T
LQVGVSASSVLRGTKFTLRATADDTRYNSNGAGDEPTQPIAAARYSVDAPSWITGTQTVSMTAKDGAFNTNVEAVRATIATNDWAAGRHTLFVESQDKDGNWGVPSAAFVEVTNTDYGVTLGEEDELTKTTAGNQVNYSLPVTNVGSMTDTYTVTVGASVWPVTAPAQVGPLAPFASAPLTVTVSVPLTATAGISDSVTITVTSEATPTLKTTRRLTTQVLNYLYYFPIVGR